jgi:hypothetical protein
MVGEKDEVVLEDGGPDESGQDPYACLREDGCKDTPWSAMQQQKRLRGQRVGREVLGGTKGKAKAAQCEGCPQCVCSLPVPVTKLNCSPCPGLCVTSPGRPRRGSSSCRAGFCSGMPVADAIAVAVAACKHDRDAGILDSPVSLRYDWEGRSRKGRKRDDCARVARKR